MDGHSFKDPPVRPFAQSARTHVQATPQQRSKWPNHADQILLFKKPGDNPIPITVQNGEVTNEFWIQWANPIWQVDVETEEEYEVGICGTWRRHP